MSRIDLPRRDDILELIEQKLDIPRCDDLKVNGIDEIISWHSKVPKGWRLEESGIQNLKKLRRFKFLVKDGKEVISNNPPIWCDEIPEVKAGSTSSTRFRTWKIALFGSDKRFPSNKITSDDPSATDGGAGVLEVIVTGNTAPQAPVLIDLDKYCSGPPVALGSNKKGIIHCIARNNELLIVFSAKGKLEKQDQPWFQDGKKVGDSLIDHSLGDFGETLSQVKKCSLFCVTVSRSGTYSVATIEAKGCNSIHSPVIIPVEGNSIIALVTDFPDYWWHKGMTFCLNRPSKLAVFEVKDGSLVESKLNWTRPENDPKKTVGYFHGLRAEGSALLFFELATECHFGPSTIFMSPEISKVNGTWDMKSVIKVPEISMEVDVPERPFTVSGDQYIVLVPLTENERPSKVDGDWLKLLAYSVVEKKWSFRLVPYEIQLHKRTRAVRHGTLNEQEAGGDVAVSSIMICGMTRLKDWIFPAPADDGSSISTLQVLKFTTTDANIRETLFPRDEGQKRVQSHVYTKDTISTPKGVIAILHGGPHAPLGYTETGQSLTVQLLVELGYKVVALNYVGGLSENQRCGGAGEKDVQSVYEALQEVNRSYPDIPVGAFGGSHGGFLSCHLADGAKRPIDINLKAVVSINPVTDFFTSVMQSDIPDWALRESLGDSAPTYDVNTFLGTPELVERHFPKMWRSGPMSGAATVDVPSLMIVGLADLRCPPIQGIKWAETVKRMNPELPVDLLRYPNIGHACRGTEDHSVWVEMEVAYHTVRWLDHFMSK